MNAPVESRLHTQEANAENTPSPDTFGAAAASSRADSVCTFSGAVPLPARANPASSHGSQSSSEAHRSTSLRILVAGGAGMIGSHLCQDLLSDEHEVLCADNLVTGRPENVAELQSN